MCFGCKFSDPHYIIDFINGMKITCKKKNIIMWESEGKNCKECEPIKTN